MPNNIAVSITADVADLQAKRAILSAELTVARKDIRALAEEAQRSGLSDALRADMLKAGDSISKLQNQIRLVDREMKTAGASAAGMSAIAGEARVATSAMGALHTGSAGATRELIVLAREASRGNFSRMAGSASILAGQLGLLQFALNPVTLAVGALTAAVIYFAIREHEAQKAAEAAAEAFALTGRNAQASVEAIRAQVDALRLMPGVSQQAAQDLIRFDAAHAQVDARLSEAANRLIPMYAKALGKDAPQALNTLKEALAGLEHGSTDEILRKFEQLNETTLNLDSNETRLVRTLLSQRDVIGTVARVLEDLSQRGGGKIESLNAEIAKTESELGAAKRALEEVATANQAAFSSMGVVQYSGDVALAQQRVDGLAARLKALKTAQATPDHGEDFSEAVANSNRTLESLKDNATKAKQAVAELHAEMEQRRTKTPDDPAVQNYFANQRRIDTDLERRLDPSDYKKPRAERQESPLTEMEVELRRQELETRERTGDWANSMADLEAKFWADKLAKAKGNSALYGQILERQQAAELAAQRAHAEQMRQVAANNISTDLSVKKTDIGDRRAAVEAQYGAAQQSAEKSGDFDAAAAAAQQKHDLLVKLDQEEAEAEKAAADATAKAQGDTVVATSEAANKRREVEASLRAKIDQLERQLTTDLAAEQEKRAHDAQEAAKKQAEGWATANREIMSAENKLVAGVLGGRQNMAQILYGIAIDLAGKEVEADLRALTQRLLLQAEGLAATQATEKGGLLFHVLTESQKTAATAAGNESRVLATAAGVAQSAAITSARNAKDVTGAAAVAAANAYKAMAGIPVVGPFLGAAAAAATFGAVEAYGAMASLAVGTNVVPNDMVAQIHAGERVMPAADNKAIIDALRGGGPAGSRGGPAGSRGDPGGSRGDPGGSRRGGDFHQHITYAPQLQAKPFRQQLDEHKSEVEAIVRTAVRRGVRDGWFN